MLYTIIGDPHCKPDNLDKIRMLFNIVESMKNPVICLGDVFDTKELIRGSCLNLVMELLGNSRLEWIILTGNHDRFNVNSKEHALEALKLIPNVFIVDEPAEFNDPCALFLPYIHHKEHLNDALKNHTAKTIFCHADINTFNHGTGHICTDGLSPEDFGTAKVISGHFHCYSQKGNITYLGTPFSHSFGETDQTKYIGVFDSETHTMELIETKFPKHKTYTIDLSTAYLLPEFDYADINRVILKGTAEEIAAVVLPSNVKRIEQPILTANGSQINETMTTESQFETWARDIKDYSDEIIDLGLQILKGVS